MKRAIPSAVLFFAVLLFSGFSTRASTFGFDGSITRSDPDDYGGLVTVDFIKLQITTPGTLAITGTAGTLLGFEFGVYLPLHRDGELVFTSAGFTLTTLPDGSMQSQGTTTVGDYYLYLGSSTDEWDRLDGIEPVVTADGGPGLGDGTFHIDIDGEFTVAQIIQGKLYSAPVPEPAVSSAMVALLLLAVIFHQHRLRIG